MPSTRQAARTATRKSAEEQSEPSAQKKPQRPKRKRAPTSSNLVEDNSEDHEPPPKKVSRTSPQSAHKLRSKTQKSKELDRKSSKSKAGARKSKGNGSQQDMSTPKQNNSGPRSAKKSSKSRSSRTVPSDESGDEMDSDDIIESRFRTRKRLSAKDLALERLRRKRLGLSPPKSEPSTDESNDESDFNSLFDEDSEEEVNSSDFIVEDDGAGAVVLPDEFSMDAHENGVDQFKKIFQFMVHLAVQTEPERKQYMTKTLKGEKYFAVPIQAMRSNLSSIRASLTNSRWKPEFAALIEKLPDYEVKDVSAATSSKICDVCGTKGKGRDWKVGRFGGYPYDRVGFKEVDDQQSESSDEDTDDERVVRPTFQLGSFCAQRTRTYHQLTHWEHNLFKAVLREVDQLYEISQGRGSVVDDNNAFVHATYRAGLAPPEDLQDADGINDWLVKRGFSDIEWKKIKDMIASAQNVEKAAKRGETD